MASRLPCLACVVASNPLATRQLSLEAVVAIVAHSSIKVALSTDSKETMAKNKGGWWTYFYVNKK